MQSANGANAKGASRVLAVAQLVNVGLGGVVVSGGRDWFISLYTVQRSIETDC